MGMGGAARVGQEVKRSGRLPFLKKRGVRRPALRELFRPILTPAEIRLFCELYARHSSKTSTNWASMCYEWNQRAALTVLQISGADNAIHQKNIPLLKKYEKELVTGIIRRDSLNSLHAYNNPSVQPIFHATPMAANRFGAYATSPPESQHAHSFAPLPYVTFGGPFMPAVQAQSLSHSQSTNTGLQDPNRPSLSRRPAKNNRGGRGVKRHCRKGCGKLIGLCTCPNRRATAEPSEPETSEP